MSDATYHAMLLGVNDGTPAYEQHEDTDTGHCEKCAAVPREEWDRRKAEAAMARRAFKHGFEYAVMQLQSIGEKLSP